MTIIAGHLPERDCRIHSFGRFLRPLKTACCQYFLD